MAKKEQDELIVKGDKAARKLAEYLKVHKLDPNKDWSKHPEHGEFIKKMTKRIKIGAERAATALSKAKALKKPEAHPKKKTVTEAPQSYDYPEVDGKPMTSEMKKKYRTRMRSLVKSGIKGAEATKKALAGIDFSKEESKAEKVAKKEEVTKVKTKKAEKPAKSSKPEITSTKKVSKDKLKDKLKGKGKDKKKNKKVED